MPDHKTKRPQTLAVHAGRQIDPVTGAVTPALYSSTTFERDPDGEYHRGYDYARSANPNREMLEHCLAALEYGKSAASFASGTAASLAVFQLAGPGGHILASADAYHGTLRQLREIVQASGTTISTVDTTDIDSVRRALAENTRLIWTESPSNPLLKISDIAALADIAHDGGTLLVCDNTFATPILQNPLKLGADLVVHSATKYLGGHSDICGGAVISSDDASFDRIRHYQNTAGAIPSPFDCWLLLRSIGTLACRVSTQSANALRIAEFLDQHTSVERVFYPGLASHPGYDLAQQQMTASGAMISFCVDGNRERAFAVAAQTKLIIRATSLGGIETLIEHRASIEGPGSLAPDNLLRLSVGIEHADDLIADLDQALS